MRHLMVGAAQLGPIARSEPRASVVARLLALMREASARGCDLVVFPELALTTFFPRWWMEDPEEIDAFFERAMPSNETAPLFDEARRLRLGFCLGFAERVAEGGRTRRFNSAILTDKAGAIVLKYRKVHLPGHADHQPHRPFQHLEKRYFEVGDLGFLVKSNMGARMGMAICNDRRWPETYRVMGLQGVEMVLIGYNTPRHHPLAPEHDRLADFHNHLSLQAGAYQNGAWVIGVAKCGVEEGCEMIGGSAIVAPTGEIVAQAATQADELVVAKCDLDLGKSYTGTTFDFAKHRQPEHYRLITERKGAVVEE